MIRVALLTVSDGVAAGKRADTSGKIAAEWVTRSGWSLAEHLVVPDETVDVVTALTRWADQAHVDVIITLGGTGFGVQDGSQDHHKAVPERRRHVENIKHGRIGEPVGDEDL